jgi:hypothetical protein
LDLDRIVAELKRERERLGRAIAALEGTDSPAATSKGKSAASSPTANRRRRGRLTAEGRKRLSEAMKKRWAERRKKGR